MTQMIITKNFKNPSQKDGFFDIYDYEYICFKSS